MSKESNVKLEANTNEKLTELSAWRRCHGNPSWRKKDIIAEIVAKTHKREVFLSE